MSSGPSRLLLGWGCERRKRRSEGGEQRGRMQAELCASCEEAIQNPPSSRQRTNDREQSQRSLRGLACVCMPGCWCSLWWDRGGEGGARGAGQTPRRYQTLDTQQDTKEMGAA